MDNMKNIWLITVTISLLWGASVFAQQKKGDKHIVIYTTAKGLDEKWKKTDTFQFRTFPQPLETQPTIFIDPKKTFQSFIGIGGALTDAAAETFARLPLAQQQELIRAYYDPVQGIGYSIGRTNINSCDFSSNSYTYVNDNDTALKTFTIQPDLKYKIPLIRLAMAATKGRLLLYASPWSPPAWMKDNNNMLQGGKLKKEFASSWANYYVKFIREYKKAGVPIWGLTVQNEPMAKQRWESCIYSAEEERDFIKNYLGPALSKNGLSNKKLIAWDHNRDLMYQRASVILSDPLAAKYVWGIGFHWYETWTGGPMQFENVKLTANAFPGKQLIFTEGCKEKFHIDSVNNWALGEKYAYSIINDFNNGTVAWTDWNILLDEHGGPNHVGNFCFAPIHGDIGSGKLIYTNAYYYIGHFSKFLQRNAQRISASSTRGQLQATAFRNPDGSIVTVVLNTGEKSIRYKIWLDGNAAEAESLPHSISTIIIE